MKNEEIRKHLRNEVTLEERDLELRSARARVDRLEADAEALKAALEANSSRGRAEQKLQMDLDNVGAMLAEANRVHGEQVSCKSLYSLVGLPSVNRSLSFTHFVLYKHLHCIA